ncbi:MAG: 16S rRNA (cytidine(1402)-2'-O)-methyltransferase [Candidatus Limimorpha sp.]|mgnify:CR=1 FL=1|nr:16S rRNA (cytidine(1402)-2'-O)-methyltransferase [Bacteroidales bacterium]MCI7376418.1 16S rRNA (cytidine(1402)-2'-O)-methyltransferase [Bacteroidales bacterium]MDD7277736.1 16S rRNA (cytidine(1402)-2'-O)-methyltransferase [Bacteroidales bacterium]MDY6075771.1 16S rRNA (cytidine(1402)-2'-O)-methyltransferase [Bacteroidales bacterium]
MKLYLVPTPIGNLEDITLRALRILREEADVILAEDTRTSGKLMKHYDISKPMIAFHLNNEHQQVRHIAERIANGERMALVTDAGTPAISDPGFMLVRECISMDIPVECLPGATAFVPALVNSGLSADHFIFEGFLPHKKGRQTKIRQIAENEYTTILYESPFRLVKTLEQLIEVAGNDRRVSVARELTKVFEENARGTLSEIRDYFSSKEVKGEIVIVLEGKKKTKEEE